MTSITSWNEVIRRRYHKGPGWKTAPAGETKKAVYHNELSGSEYITVDTDDGYGHDAEVFAGSSQTIVCQVIPSVGSQGRRPEY